MKKFLGSAVIVGFLFASGFNHNLSKIIPDKNTVLVNQEYIDGLSKDWNLIGIEHNITDLSIFKNIDIAWMYNNKTKKWEVYSPMPDIDIDALPYRKITSIPAGSGIWVYRKINLPKFKYFDYEIVDKNENEAQVRLKVNIYLPQDSEYNLFYESKAYNNNKEINLSFLPPMDDNYSVADVNLSGGYHKITICQGVGFANFSPATVRYNVCKSIELSIDLPISKDKYTNKINLGFSSNALANDGKYLYVIDRNNYYLYKINPMDGSKEKLFRVSSYPNSLDIYNGYFYIGEGHNEKIVKYDKYGKKISSYDINFPDGLTIMNGKIYVVQHDRDGKLLLLNADNFTKIGILDTGVNDICGLSHNNKYLYVLAEDGDIYRINPDTKEKIKIFNNQKFLRDNNSNEGIEGITVYNGYLWISYTNDDALYKINIPID